MNINDKSHSHPPRFISYSHNFEDVILNRLFREQEIGFFVDIGAADPKMENDCYALYNRGWHGINVEPNPTLADLYPQQRPRDITLQVAVDAVEGQRSYYLVEGTGLSTLDHSDAERYREEGWTVCEVTIPTRTLSNIFANYAPEQIDLLKIDVEGWEEHVLRGNDWERYKPRVIVVECTYPQTPERRVTEIEDLLTSVGYKKVWFDGLNDFYCHEASGISAEAFAAPVNVFDNFENYQLAEAHQHITNLQQSSAMSTAFANDEQKVIERKDNELRELQDKLLNEARVISEMKIAHEQLIDRHSNLDKSYHIALSEIVTLKKCVLSCGILENKVLVQSEALLSLQESLANSQQKLDLYATEVEATHVDRQEIMWLRTRCESLEHEIKVNYIERRDMQWLQQHCENLEQELKSGSHVGELVEAHESIMNLQKLTENLQVERDILKQQRNEAQKWWDAVRQSTSWRATRPIRVTIRVIKSLFK